jgi:aspartate/glutamate racemase
MSQKPTSQKLAIIHTTPVTVDSFKALAAEVMPDVRVINFVDDSILPQLAEVGGDTSAVEARLVQYARYAQEVGADVILSACSSVGEVAAKMQDAVRIPVVRIDDAMAEEAVRRGTRIGVAATVPTTLTPTVALLRRKAQEAGIDASFETRCVTEAYERLLAGDREGHDTLLARALAELASSTDVVVLAQASMARVLERLPEEQRTRFLSSPRFGMQRVREALAQKENTHAARA